MDLITFKLTKSQYKKLVPLFDRTKIFKKGSIIFQPFEHGWVTAGYIPPKYAIQIQKIISKIKPERG